MAGGTREHALSEVATKANGATPCPMDLTEPDSIESLAQRLRVEVGRLDVLVLSSGTIAFGEHGEAGIDDLDAQYAANLRAPYLLVQSLLPLLREAQGQVVFVNSTAGLGARPGVGQFAATQATFRSMADSLRQEVNEQGIRVVGCSPAAPPRHAPGAHPRDRGQGLPARAADAARGHGPHGHLCARAAADRGGDRHRDAALRQAARVASTGWQSSGSYRRRDTQPGCSRSIAPRRSIPSRDGR